MFFFLGGASDGPPQPLKKTREKIREAAKKKNEHTKEKITTLFPSKPQKYEEDFN